MSEGGLVRGGGWSKQLRDDVGDVAKGVVRHQDNRGWLLDAVEQQRNQRDLKDMSGFF